MNCNLEQRECVAVAKIVTSIPVLYILCVCMYFIHTGTSISHGLAAFVHSLLDSFSHNYCIYFNHDEYDATTKSVDKGFV